MSNLKEDRKKLKSMIVLFKAHMAITELIKEDIKKHSFDLNELSVFEVIYHKKKITIQDIKSKILVANSSLTYILDKLLFKELITRTKDLNDKRISYIELTEKGLKTANNLFLEHYKMLEEVFSVLKEEEKENLINTLKKVGYNAKAFK